MGYDEEEDGTDDDDLPSVGDAIRSGNRLKVGGSSSSNKKDKPSTNNSRKNLMGVGMMDEDDVDDFIDDDDDSQNEGSLDEETGERRKKKRNRNSSSNGIGLNGDGKAGIDREAWEELNDLFGDGQDYDWAMKADRRDDDGNDMDLDADDEDEDEEEEDDDKDDEGLVEPRKEKKKKGKKSGVAYKDVSIRDSVKGFLHSVSDSEGQILIILLDSLFASQIFEPAQIAEGMLTLEDDLIRRSDLPERYQLTLPGDDGLALLERKLTSSELDSATKWVGPRISSRCTQLFLNSSGSYFNHSKDWYGCVRTMLDHSLNSSLEAPYLYQHKYDELEFDTNERDSSGGKKRADYLVRRELAALVHLGLKFKTLLKRKEKLKITFEKLMTEIDGTKEEEVDEADQDALSFEEAEKKQKKREKIEQEKSEFHSILESSASAEEISDLTEWLVMKYGQRMRDAQASTSDYNLSNDLDSTLSLSTKTPVFKKPSIIGVYERTKHSIISKLSEKIGITASELASNISSLSGSRNYFPDDESSSPEVLSSEYEVEEWHHSGSALKAAQMLLANEIGRHPIMKREVRKLFMSTSKINVNPTERGIVKIDNQHPFYNFKFLKDKPIGSFLAPPPLLDSAGNKIGMSTSASAAQWLQILKAETDLLVNVKIDLPESTLKGLVARLFTNYNGEGTSEASKRWNEVRREIVEQAVTNYLIPNAKNWIKEWLKEECTDVITKNAETNLIRVSRLSKIFVDTKTADQFRIR